MRKRAFLLIALGVAALAAFWIFWWRTADEDSVFEASDDDVDRTGAVDDPRAAADPVSRRKTDIRRFMKMRRALQERRRVDEPEERLVPVRMPRELSDEELFAAQMNHHERVVNESRIIDDIERLIDEGKRGEAAQLLRQQRRRFPELNSVETRAFNLLARCIQSPSIAAAKAGLHFADTHPGSRLTQYLQRICKD